MNENTAWESIPQSEEGTCATCRYLNRNIGYLSYPTKYECELTGEIHFADHKCDVHGSLKDGDTE